MFLLIQHPKHVLKNGKKKWNLHLCYEFGKIKTIEQLRILIFKKHCIRKHCYEAPRSMLSNYFNKKQVFRGTFGDIWRIQIQFYPKPYVELEYGGCILKNEVSAHRLGFVVQLS